MDVQIREFRPSDYPEVCGLMNQVYKIHVRKRPDIFSNVDNTLSEAEFQQDIDDEDTITLLAEKENSAVGFCIMKIKPPAEGIRNLPRKIAYINEICVHEKFRKQGIGKLLFEEARRSAESSHVDSLELRVWSFNTSAIEFYESMGMKAKNMIMELDMG